MTDRAGQSDRASNPLAELRSHLGTGNAWPVLSEIETALRALLDRGETTIIDLGAIPFGPGDERVFDDVLGAGELSATIDTLGKSIVSETGIPGVWRVDHFDQRGETLSRFVEVTFCPEILGSQREDAEIGHARLEARLKERDGQVN